MVETHRTARFTAICHYLSITLVGVGLSALALAAALMADWDAVALFGHDVPVGLAPVDVTWLSLGLAAVGLLLFALGVARTRQAVAMRAARAPTHEAGPVLRAVNTASRASGAVGALLTLVFSAAVAAGLAALAGTLLAANPLALSVTGLVIALAIALVVVAIIAPPRALGGLWPGPARLLRGWLPTYTVQDDSVAIDLRLRRAGEKQSTPIHIRFDELDEVRALNHVEATAYLRYEVGPDADLMARQTRGMADYARGAIARPSVYTVGATDVTWGPIVLLRGPEVFYMVPVAADSADDLVAAFEAARVGQAQPSA